jgi:opacity protein-like surface antigen
MRDLAVGLVLILASVPVVAQPGAPQESIGFYAGGGLGSTQPASYDADFWYSDTESGDSTTSVVGFLGYRFHKHVAVEAAYLDAGSVGWSEPLVYVPALLDLYNTDIALDVSALQVSVTGVLPFGEIWEGYLRGGLAFWEADGTQRFTPSFGGTVVTRSVSDDGTGFLFGLGGSARLLPNLHLRLEYQVFDVDEDLFVVDGSDSATMDTFLLGVEYRFGGARRP